MRLPEAVVPSEWLEDGISRIPSQYVNCVNFRSAMLFNRLQASRRTPMSNTRTPMSNRVCTADCGEMESLAHIIQKCPSTEDLRHARHDSNVRMLETVLMQMGYSWNGERYIVCY